MPGNAMPSSQTKSRPSASELDLVDGALANGALQRPSMPLAARVLACSRGAVQRFEPFSCWGAGPNFCHLTSRKGGLKPYLTSAISWSIFAANSLRISSTTAFGSLHSSRCPRAPPLPVDQSRLPPGRRPRGWRNDARERCIMDPLSSLMHSFIMRVSA